MPEPDKAWYGATDRAPSGRRYRVLNRILQEQRSEGLWWHCKDVPVEDVLYTAQLLLDALKEATDV